MEPEEEMEEGGSDLPYGGGGEGGALCERCSSCHAPLHVAVSPSGSGLQLSSPPMTPANRGVALQRAGSELSRLTSRCDHCVY